jgi:hypothetical protein
MKMLSLLALLPLGAVAEVVDFEGMPIGSPPSGWTIANAGRGGAPRWEIVTDSTSPAGARVLAQLSEDAAPERIAIALHPAAPLQNGAVSLRFKPVSGSVDRVAGIVWRYRDENNYYVVRANALEDTIVLDKVEQGRRTSLAPAGKDGQHAVGVPVPTGRWSALRVAFMSARFVVSFDEKPLFEVEDSTFAGPGRVGVWTKADSVTHFDAFEVLPAAQ